MSEVRALFASNAITNATVVGVTETIIATLATVSTVGADNTVRLKGWAQITPGTDATSIALGVRRTNAAGTLVGTRQGITFGAAATQKLGFDIMVQDQPGDVASMTYVLTATQAGGVADGTALQVYLEAIVA